MHRHTVLCAGKNTSKGDVLGSGDPISERTLSEKHLCRGQQLACGRCQVLIGYLGDLETPVWCCRNAGRDLEVLIEQNPLWKSKGDAVVLHEVKWNRQVKGQRRQTCCRRTTAPTPTLELSNTEAGCFVGR